MLLQINFNLKNIKEAIEKSVNYKLPEFFLFQIEKTPEGWFVATSTDLPGLITEGKDKQELLYMIEDALLTYFDVPNNHIESKFESSSRLICNTV
ncbi:MAG: hypothetical protein A2821_00435 [Candidatus Magasanikbacteria bacterium RIFCSPHIGHO2_01_FULL_41_23]|uniref:HicB-like antitoxin of toxin-antitoxin system domain-containing protein n=1 Tax=Candidatus Magasanikbacteria bacterium RIFCSPLOWO2_01_FULL_40_15 TaxID=1798686 RepID=A0A1F6N0A9_9BACT|nr:MAG: hypothetical protein A2821_00435 [Candidatus Magasanikbacteria bacterium RIFCSPHIGHO2_01_FULL_41_23]OGH74646.1 MAG: hypothetical protein A3F22_01790 [Candidatus Magasanikbacteria bacterium RIFCSPHIGHO2_12_FULL_41_16]OGH77359.1 MAG: hypothetical protein A2983_01490 [Candidatus Magasanikbacteria bacterium RIFCSPLOWO2_01_FULL_40_15]